MKSAQEFETEVLKSIKNIENLNDLDKLRVEYLGKKGKFSFLMQTLKTLEPDIRKQTGAAINTAKQNIEKLILAHKKSLESELLNQKLKNESIDVTLPGRGQIFGFQHPLTRVTKDITDYFQALGFSLAEGPEIEDDYHNFEALNIPKHHSARAMHDTFYINPTTLLRTHTSPVQIRTLKKQKPPIAIICPGKVYRCDSDQTHSPMFHQIEALYLAKKVTFADLKTLLIQFLKHFFQNDKLVLRFRPSYFPFTEPSAEVDIQWDTENNTTDIKWLEVLGCGMIHPNVLTQADIDPEQYQGFALGLGVERFAMLRYGLHDLRQFFENDIRFLAQFNA
ncbi:MAG: phenylalanine--tRNA ligase subunit alpha [Endozoicomonadaceae bacterium]|nr:phenylalanine--tRNA ligase subunit alpha [Endozoicomonadaceae bacterium]MBE8233509.1 phenylalanine--tRNA ligase subunit alpha [Endozoicomonadaceae bacterium]